MAAIGTFDIWLRRQAEMRDGRELDRKRTLERLIAWMDAHAAGFEIGSIAIIGSITRPFAFHQNSDIDLGLTCKDAALCDRFAAAIERALCRSVDTVDLDTCRFAAAALEEAIWWTPFVSAS